MSNSPLHRSCQSSPWGQNWPRLILGKNLKNVLQHNIYLEKQHLVLPNINPANQSPGVQTGLAMWIINSHRLVIGKT